MSVSASVRAAKPASAETATDGQHRQPGRRGRPVEAETMAQRRKATIAAACADLAAGLEALPLWETAGPTCDALEQCLQELLRPVHGRLEQRLLGERVAAIEAAAPLCPHGHGRMERQERQRSLEGVLGPVQYCRGYFRCRTCDHAAAVADEVLGMGPGRLTPGLSRIAAMHAVQDAFGHAARTINATLRTQLSEDAVYRTTEALGAVADAESATGTGASAPDPTQPLGANTLLVGADGTTTHTDGDWHEVKVGLVVSQGPEVATDPKTGRRHLQPHEQTFCALVGGADSFFPRLETLARQSGFDHPQLHTAQCIGDGGEWIWNRMGRFDRPGLRRIETLDYIHAAEHLWTLGGQLHGSNTPEAHGFARPLADLLKDQGADPVLLHLNGLLPGASDAEAAAINAALDYLDPHAQVGRTEYPVFAAEGLAIASGTVESSCRIVVCQRTKSSGMRWRRRGAQSVLALRCLFLTPSRWDDFFERKPCLRRPPVASLRTDDHAA